MGNAKKLPAGWFNCYLIDICKLNMGQSPDSSTYNDVKEGLPFYQGKTEFGDLYPTPAKYCNRPNKIADAGNVLLSVRAPVGPTNLLNHRACIGRGLAAIEPCGDIPSKFILYLFRNIQKKLSEVGTGTTFKAITKDVLCSLKLNLPPLAEQHRIVEKLEELFSELDQGIETLKAAQQQLKLYRQAVLKWAFEGKLTETWRSNNALTAQSLRNSEIIATGECFKIPEKWITTDLEYIAKAIDPHPSHRTPPACKDGIPYIGISECNYENVTIDFANARKVSPEILKDHIDRYQIIKGDFIIGKIGTIGKPFKVPEDRCFALSANVILIQPYQDLIETNYLFYLFQSNVIEKQFLKGLNATTQSAFGIQKVRMIKIPYCTINEQQQIVQEIESRLSVCDKLEETIEHSLAQAAALRQSILKKAFEGKLVPQDPNDEPAELLLARIRAEREQQAPKKTTKGRTKK